MATGVSLLKGLEVDLFQIRLRLTSLLSEPWFIGSQMQLNKYLMEHELVTQQIAIATLISDNSFDDTKFSLAVTTYLALLKEVS